MRKRSHRGSTRPGHGQSWRHGWKDPDFKPNQRAFCNVRMFEIPTPRWTAFDAKLYGIKMPAEVPMTLQERAYTSPEWYTPAKGIAPP